MAFQLIVSLNSILKGDDMGTEVEPMKCNGRYIDLYVEKSENEEYQAWFTDEKIKGICPTLDQTCCSFDEINSQFSNFKKARDHLNSRFELLRKLAKNLATVKVENLEMNIAKPIDDNNEMLENLDGGSSDKSSHSKDLVQKAQLKDKINLIKESYKNLITHLNASDKVSKEFVYQLSKFYSGFICQFCHPEASLFNSEIDSKNGFQLFPGFKKYARSIDIDPERTLFFYFNDKNFIGVNKLVIPFFSLLFAIANAYETFNNIVSVMQMEIEFRNANGEKIQLPSPSSSEDLKVTYDKCKGLLEKKELREPNEHMWKECQEMWFEIMRSGTEFTLFAPIEQFIVLLNKYVKNMHNDPTLPDVDISEVKDKLVFTKKNEESEFNKINDNSKVVILEEKGFTMDKYQFNEKLWKNISVLSLCFALIFLLLH